MSKPRSLIITLNADDTVTLQCVDNSCTEDIVVYERNVRDIKAEFISLFSLFVNEKISTEERTVLNSLLTRVLEFI